MLFTIGCGGGAYGVSLDGGVLGLTSLYMTKMISDKVSLELA